MSLLSNSPYGIRPRLSAKWIVGIVVAAIVGTLATTLAANIVINTGGRVEFGQGRVSSGLCDSYITIKPTAAFVNNVFVLDTVEIGDISTLTHDNSYTIQIYGDTSSVGLLANPATFKVGSDGVTFSQTSTGDNTTLETVTADSATSGGGSNSEIGASKVRFTQITSNGVSAIPTSAVKKITLQSSGNGNCSRVYALGDVGPAGGTIGITPSTPGNTTGKYFEFGVPETNGLTWCPSSDPGYSVNIGTTYGIGAGAANTALIVANCSAGSGVYADQYTLGGYSDWFLPSPYELNAVKDIAPPGGYATSGERGAGSIYYQNIPNGQPVLNDHAGKWFSLRTLPMRSFTP